MRTIAIVNLKGGVGKTVTSINTAYILAAEHKQRVLLIDADRQGNTTEFFGGNPEVGNLAEVMRNSDADGAYGRYSIQRTKYERIDLLAASDALMDLDLTKIENRTIRSTAIRELVTALAETDSYDYILIDCPPAFNAASASALLAADSVIIPIKLDAFSLRGMANLVRQIVNMRRINPALRVDGCLETMWYSSDDLKQADETLHQSDLPVFKTKIRRTAFVDGMTFAQQPLCLYSPHSSAGIDYRRFVREFVKGGTLHG